MLFLKVVHDDEECPDDCLKAAAGVLGYAPSQSGTRVEACHPDRCICAQGSRTRARPGGPAQSGSTVRDGGALTSHAPAFGRHPLALPLRGSACACSCVQSVASRRTRTSGRLGNGLTGSSHSWRPHDDRLGRSGRGPLAVWATVTGAERRRGRHYHTRHYHTRHYHTHTPHAHMHTHTLAMDPIATKASVPWSVPRLAVECFRIASPPLELGCQHFP